MVVGADWERFCHCQQCTNSSQPSLETLSGISEILNVKLSDLVRKDYVSIVA